MLFFIHIAVLDHNVDSIILAVAAELVICLNILTIIIMRNLLNYLIGYAYYSKSQVMFCWIHYFI